MKRLPPLTVVAALAFALAWFLPVHKDGSTLSQGVLPGWEAFLIAIDIDGSNLVTTVIHVVSALTNGLMLFAVVRQVRRPTRPPPRWLAAGFLAATAVDLWWASDSDRADLRIGYWLWVGSFALMAVAIWPHRRLESRRTA